MKVWLEVRGQLIWGAILMASAGAGFWANELAKAGQTSDIVRIVIAFLVGAAVLVMLTLVYAILRVGSPDPQDQL